MRPGSIRRPILAIAAGCCALGLSFTTQTLAARLVDDRLQVSSLGLHFLTGKMLERLHSGVSVAYGFQLTLSTIPRSIPLERALERFVVSYDVWGETFKVAQTGGLRKSAAYLSANAAEFFCIDQMGVSLSGAPADKDLWLRLDIRAEDSSAQSSVTESGFSLTSLIELFSGRPSRSAVQEWNAETAPFRLNTLKR